MSALILDYSTDIQQFSTKANPQVETSCGISIGPSLGMYLTMHFYSHPLQDKFKEEEASKLVQIEEQEQLVMAKVLIKRAQRQKYATSKCLFIFIMELS